MALPDGDHVLPINERDAHLVGSYCHCRPSIARDASDNRRVILHWMLAARESDLDAHFAGTLPRTYSERTGRR